MKKCRFESGKMSTPNSVPRGSDLGNSVRRNSHSEAAPEKTSEAMANWSPDRRRPYFGALMLRSISVKERAMKALTKPTVSANAATVEQNWGLSAAACFAAGRERKSVG